MIDDGFTKEGTRYICDKCAEEVINWRGNPDDYEKISLILINHRLEHVERQIVNIGYIL